MEVLTGRSGTVILALLALLAGGFFAEVVIDSDEPGKTRTIRVEVGKTRTTVDLPKLPPIEVDANTQDGTDAAADADTAELHEDARDETPVGVDRSEADEALVTPDGVGKPKPAGGAQNYRCERNYVVNFSNRAAGTKVSMFPLHFTVSRPGSLASIRSLFNTPSFGASSTFGLELDGECEQWVPFDKKPWTQGAFNSVSESVEIVCCNAGELSRSEWLAAPIIKRGILANIVADRLRARGLPPRLVDPVGCTPKAGVTDHDRLECGNSHWDVGKNFPWDVFMRQVRRYHVGVDVLAKPKRSHRILHAKLKQCPERASATACKTWRSQNRALHDKYGGTL
jgi:hypothetical protein